MKKFIRQILLLKILLVLILFTATGQEKPVTDTVSLSLIKEKEVSESVKKERKNIINFNITNPLLISNKFQIIGYERILPNNQSFTVNIGTFSLPRFLNGKIADSLGIITDSKDKGFHFSADYRFYLAKLNRYNAPRGVYLAPYYSFNYLNRQNSWRLDNYVEEVFTNTKISIHTVGIELGYQFVFWDRMTLDLILLGPGYGFYGIKSKLGTTLDPVDESKLFEKINNILEDRIPGYDKIIEPSDFVRKGSYKTTNIGYRYVIRVGFLF